MVFQRLCRVWKERGTVGLIRQIIRRIAPVHFSMVYQKSHRSDFQVVHGLSVKRYSERSKVDSEVIDILKVTRDGNLMQEAYKLFSNGCQLWTGSLNGKLAGICWSKSGHNRTDYFVLMAKTDATIMSCFVYPEFRGRGIYPAMLQIMTNMLMEQDQIHTVYIDCRIWNKPSIRGIQKAGFVLLGRAVRMILFGHVIILWNGCRGKYQRVSNGANV